MIRNLRAWELQGFFTRLRKDRDNLGKEIDGNKPTLRRVRREREEAKDGVEKGKKEIDGHPRNEVF